MIKIKTLKLTLFMGVIACFVAVFCCMQSAFASDVNSDNVSLDSPKSDISDSNDENVRGRVTGNDSGRSYLFKSFEELEPAINDEECLGNDKSIQIELYMDFDINDNTLKIKNGRTLKIVFNGHFLWSSCNRTMIKVEDGNLILDGQDKNNRGKVQQTGEESAFKILEGATVQVNHVWFRDKSGERKNPSYGGVFYFDDLSNDQIFNDCVFQDVKASCGGAIHVNSSSKQYQTIKFNDCEFKRCYAGIGGVIESDAEYVNVEFNNSLFNGCNSCTRGGVIETFGDNENITFNNCTIENCYCDREGGAIYNYAKYCNYIFNDTKVNNCHCNLYGGFIYSYSNHEKYYFNNSLITSCKSIATDGGAIYVESDDVMIYGCEPTKPLDQQKLTVISDCNAYGNGGAIYTSSTSCCGNDVKIYGFKFINNSAENAGGAISVQGSRNRIENCYFDNNHASKANTVELDRVLVSDNYTNQIVCKDLKDFNYVSELGEKGNLDTERAHFIPIVPTHKLHGACGFVDNIGKDVDFRPIANLTVDILDVNNNVIDTTKTDGNGLYAFTLKIGSKVKVRVHLPGDTNPRISNLIDMNTDYEINFTKRDL